MAKEPDKQIVLDNRFFVPPGVIDVRQAGAEEGDTFYDTPRDIAVEGPVLGNPGDAIPMAPSTYEIVEQRVRHGSDGSARVDVTLEFDDVYGIDTIDVRITKA